MTSGPANIGTWNWARSGSITSLLLAFFFSAPAHAQTRFDGQILPAYFTGDFDSGVDTEILYVPLIFRVSTARQDFRVTIPFLHVRTEEPVIFVGGDILPRGEGGVTTESGPGDVILKEEVFFVRGDGRKRPWISGIGRVKLPTADEEKGLGTGELDYGPGGALIQPVGRWVNLLAEVQYVVRGDPPEQDLRNTLWTSAGIHWRLSDSTSLSLVYDDRQSVIEGRENLRDLSVGYDQRLSPSVTSRVTAYLGLSDTAEDYGVSLGLSMRGGS